MRMSERLTEQQLADMEQWASCDLNKPEGDEVCAAIAELRHLRAQALSAEEREALEFAKTYLRAGLSPISGGPLMRAVAVLTRLTSEPT